MTERRNPPMPATDMRHRAGEDPRMTAVLHLHHRDGLRCAADLRSWPCPTRHALDGGDPR